MGHSRITEEDVYFDGVFCGDSVEENNWMKDLLKDDPYGIWNENGDKNKKNKFNRSKEEYIEDEFDFWFETMKRNQI